MVTKRHNLQQVHGGDQSPLPPSWNSFLGTGIHDRPVPHAKHPTESKIECNQNAPFESQGYMLPCSLLALSASAWFLILSESLSCEAIWLFHIYSSHPLRPLPCAQSPHILRKVSRQALYTPVRLCWLIFFCLT